MATDTENDRRNFERTAARSLTAKKHKQAYRDGVALRKSQLELSREAMTELELIVCSWITSKHDAATFATTAA